MGSTFLSHITHTAQVISGTQRGAKLGFPTLNLVIPEHFTEPFGIYAGWGTIDTVRYRGAFHYGPIPVFEKPEPSLEVFVLDTTLTTPPAEIVFEFIRKVRDIQHFPDADALKEQIALDIILVREILR